MAIQNFLSGGYYGKLGATIGQRWKNKRTVKAYAIPTNPRTEKQQANRKKFSSGVKLAQLATAVDFKSSLFSSDENTRWGLRMSVAKINTDSGVLGLNAVPLAPSGFIPNYTVENAILENEGAASAPIITLEGVLPSEVQTFAVLLNNGEDLPDIENTLIMYVDFDPSTNQITLPQALAGQVHAGQFMRIISFTENVDVSDVCMSYALEIKTGSLPLYTFEYANMRFTQDETLKTLVLADVEDSSASGTVSLQVQYSYGVESLGVSEITVPLKNDSTKLYVEFETPNQNEKDSLSTYVTSYGFIKITGLSISSSNYNYVSEEGSIAGSDYSTTEEIELSVSNQSGVALALENSEVDWGRISTEFNAVVKSLDNRLWGKPYDGVGWDTVLTAVSQDSAEGSKFVLRTSASDLFPAFSDWCKVSAFSLLVTGAGVSRTFVLKADSHFTNDIKTMDLSDREMFESVDTDEQSAYLFTPLYGLGDEEEDYNGAIPSMSYQFAFKGSSAVHYPEDVYLYNGGDGSQLQLSLYFSEEDAFPTTDGNTAKISLASGESGFYFVDNVSGIRYNFKSTQNNLVSA
ncbi:MAG: hypothetical protein ACI4VW_00515 [Acutalibacteraceae bacterium]